MVAELVTLVHQRGDERFVAGHAPGDEEERRPCLVVAQHSENLTRVHGIGAVIERERDDSLPGRHRVEAAR